jgi:DNA processing protein
MSRIHWLALTHIPGVGGATVRRLLERFESVEAIFAADPTELAKVPRLSEQAITAIKAISLAEVEAELLALTDEGITFLTWDDLSYPALLRDLPDPPPVLFVLGTLLPEDEKAVAIVGSREASKRGLIRARHLGQALASRGLTVVSGLALGIDTAAHEGALEARGRTLAVLGSGLKAIHALQNQELVENITNHGAMLSELHPEAPPRGPYLMARDRIIAALSRAVIVVEAKEKSGSLDTAQRAKRLGRLVLACVGSPGTDALLQAGVAQQLNPETAGPDALVALREVLD